MGLRLEHPQVTANPVAAGLATVEGADRAALGRLTHVQCAHLLARLLDMSVDNPAITLGQASQQHKQQFVVAQGRAPTQAFT
ncbi:hypothetical protein PFLmoz3_01746 [Pseudomonas fluorescens]|uniref:Uncharacterized protein n=1 Tax=Pseudomonas fluorescens TaxID=294 RepID=A0A109LJR5_PSEFL|nr:hypothetical protein PFLmoz3_01746 [Pseudomonas fluorescens]